jgi:hypothetical protein
MYELFAAVIIVFAFAILIRGSVLVFTENFWLATIMLFLLLPLLLIWVIFKGFFG